MKYRGSVWTLGFWLKMTLSCGLYILWWWNEYITVTSTYVEKVWGIPSNKKAIPLKEIRALKQSVNGLGKIFHYATITINSLDNNSITFTGLHNGTDLFERVSARWGKT